MSDAAPPPVDNIVPNVESKAEPEVAEAVPAAPAAPAAAPAAPLTQEEAEKEALRQGE